MLTAVLICYYKEDDDMVHLYRPFVVFLLPLVAHSFAPHHQCRNIVERRGSSRRYPSSNSPQSPASAGFHQLKLAAAPGQLPVRQEQPILARAYARALRVALRCGTVFGTIDGLVVSCEASSNRSVALGRIASINVGFDRLSSPFLKTGDFQLAGKDVELGFAPVLLLASPFLLLLWRIKVISFSYLLFLCLVVPRLARKLGAGPREDKVSVASYRLGLSAEDLSAPNTLLRMAVNRAMDHLLRNSVVGMLTESTLAAAKVQAATPKRDLTAKTPEEQMRLLTAAVDKEVAAPSSTKLELKKVTIGDNGRILLDAVAAFPDPSSGDDELTSRLDIVVRLAVSPLDEAMILPAKEIIKDPQQGSPASIVVRPNGCGIMVSNAELKASFNKDTLGVPLTIFGRPIPDIWIPVVSGGLAFPLGYWHRIQSVKSWESHDRMEICGELYFNGDAPVQKNNNGWPFLGDSGGDCPSLPPPKRPVLPGGT